jgi:hypothetical protein
MVVLWYYYQYVLLWYYYQYGNTVVLLPMVLLWYYYQYGTKIVCAGVDWLRLQFI